MTSRLGRALALVSATALATSVLGPAAHAAGLYAAPVVAAPDTSTTGHVTGTVTSEAPYVRIELLDRFGTVVGTTSSTGSAATYDFETWGWSTVSVRATACTTPEDCPGGSTVAGPVATTTVQPTITWPSDTTIGTQNATYTIDVQDSGGGFLLANWNGTTMPVPSNGQVDLMPVFADDGYRYLTILRCSSAHPTACVPAVNRPLRIWRYLQATATGGGSFRPDGTSAPDGVAHYRLDMLGYTLAFAYTLRPAGGQPVRSGTVDVTTDGNGDTAVALDLTGLADGSYLLDGTFSFYASSYGTITGTPQSSNVLTVDTRAPEIRSIAFDRSTVYPVVDGYQDTVSFHATGDGQDTSLTQATYDVLDGAGQVVWSVATTPPAGLTGDGATWSPGAAPAGTYVVRATVRDAAGNTSTATSAPVTLSRKRLVERHFYRLVRAKASMVSRSVGRCSILRSPSLRGLAGSLGLYSGARCARQGAAATVQTVHRMRVPDEVLGGRATIYLDGGASNARRSGRAWFGWRTGTGSWRPFSRAAWFMGSHKDKGGAVPVADLVTPGGYLTWGARVDAGNRYDILSFAVAIDYLALR